MHIFSKTSLQFFIFVSRGVATKCLQTTSSTNIFKNLKFKSNWTLWKKVNEHSLLKTSSLACPFLYQSHLPLGIWAFGGQVRLKFVWEGGDKLYLTSLRKVKDGTTPESNLSPSKVNAQFLKKKVSAHFWKNISSVFYFCQQRCCSKCLQSTSSTNIFINSNLKVIEHYEKSKCAIFKKKVNAQYLKKK